MIGFKIGITLTQWAKKPVKQGICRLHKPVMGSKRNAQSNWRCAGVCLDFAGYTIEDAYLHLAEAVDALLGIPNHEKFSRPISLKQAHEDVVSIAFNFWTCARFRIIHRFLSNL